MNYPLQFTPQDFHWIDVRHRDGHFNPGSVQLCMVLQMIRLLFECIVQPLNCSVFPNKWPWKANAPPPHNEH